jgi:hypothetical protein
MVHCSGGAQSKVGHFLLPGLHVIKDNMLPVPPLFRLIQECSGTAWSEMYKVGRCSLSVSKPVLKAPMVSALDTMICRTAFKLCFQVQLAPLQQGVQLRAPHGGVRAGRGRAVQVDPIKPTLKAPGIKLLKLKCDKPLSNFAFKFNSRRYTEDAEAVIAVSKSFNIHAQVVGRVEAVEGRSKVTVKSEYGEFTYDAPH